MTTAIKKCIVIWSALTNFLNAVVKFFGVIDQNPFHNINITILKVQFWNACNSEKCRFKQFTFPCTKVYDCTGHCIRKMLLPHTWFYQINKWTHRQLIFMHIILFTANISLNFMIFMFLSIELWEACNVLFVSKMMSSPVWGCEFSFCLNFSKSSFLKIKQNLQWFDGKDYFFYLASMLYQENVAG